MLPNAENAYIPSEKLIVHLLERDLLSIPKYNETYEQITSPYGKKYVVTGVLETLRGTTVVVDTVWIAEPPDEKPRFVTAYPG